MPYLNYVDHAGYVMDFEVSEVTNSRFVGQGMVSFFRDVFDLTLWLAENGLDEEFRRANSLANALIITQNYENSSNNGRTSKMTLTKEQAKIVTLLDYFGPLSESELIAKTKSLKLYSQGIVSDQIYMQLIQSDLNKLRYELSILRTSTHNSVLKYKADVGYGAY
jgi:hypothetical protein